MHEALGLSRTPSISSLYILFTLIYFSDFFVIKGSLLKGWWWWWGGGEVVFLKKQSKMKRGSGANLYLCSLCETKIFRH